MLVRFFVHGQLVGVCSDIHKLDRMTAAIKRRFGTFKHLSIRG